VLARDTRTRHGHPRFHHARRRPGAAASRAGSRHSAPGRPGRLLRRRDAALVLRAGGEAGLLRADARAQVVRMPLKRAAREAGPRADATIVRAPARAAREGPMSVDSPREIPTSAQVAREFRARLLRFIRARVASPADAEDIVQDVLLRMHRSVRSLSAGERLGAWLFQVARNAVVDHYRARGRGAAVLDARISPDAVADEVAAATDEDPRRLERDATHCLAAFIERLDPRQAEALRLVDVDGLTHRAAAARIGLGVPGVKSRVQRARASLKKALDDCCTLDFAHPDGLVAFDTGSAASSCGSACASRGGACAPRGKSPPTSPAAGYSAAS